MSPRPHKWCALGAPRGGECGLGPHPAEGTSSAALRGNDSVVTLDVEMTPELRAEGLARDLVRLIQQARKAADLTVTDRIDVSLALPPSLAEQLEPWLDFVAGEVLATSLTLVEPGHTVGATNHEGLLEGETVTFAITVA